MGQGGLCPLPGNGPSLVAHDMAGFWCCFSLSECLLLRNTLWWQQQTAGLSTPTAAHPFFHQGGKTTSFSFSPITFPVLCLQLAAHFPCVYPTQYLLLSLFLLEDQAGTLSNDGHIITITTCSAVLNIHGSRKSGCLLARVSLIKNHKKHLGKSPHSSLKAAGTNLKKKIRTPNVGLPLFLN